MFVGGDLDAVDALVGGEGTDTLNATTIGSVTDDINDFAGVSGFEGLEFNQTTSGTIDGIVSEMNGAAITSVSFLDGIDTNTSASEQVRLEQTILDTVNLQDQPGGSATLGGSDDLFVGLADDGDDDAIAVNFALTDTNADFRRNCTE